MVEEAKQITSSKKWKISTMIFGKIPLLIILIPIVLYSAIMHESMNEVENENSCGVEITYSKNNESGKIINLNNGYGKARLDFGNRGLYGHTTVHLNGNEIGTAYSKVQTKKIEFDFNDGGELMLSGHDGKIKINSFKLLSWSCSSKNVQI